MCRAVANLNMSGVYFFIFMSLSSLAQLAKSDVEQHRDAIQLFRSAVELLRIIVATTKSAAEFVRSLCLSS